MESTLEQEPQPPKRAAWGMGRIAFRSHLPTIQKLLEADWPLSSIHQHLKTQCQASHTISSLITSVSISLYDPSALKFQQAQINH